VIALKGPRSGLWCLDTDQGVRCLASTIGAWEKFTVERPDPDANRIILRGGRTDLYCTGGSVAGGAPSRLAMCSSGQPRDADASYTVLTHKFEPNQIALALSGSRFCREYATSSGVACGETLPSGDGYFTVKLVERGPAIGKHGPDNT
jgi:hypothetical protein